LFNRTRALAIVRGYNKCKLGVCCRMASVTDD